MIEEEVLIILYFAIPGVLTELYISRHFAPKCLFYRCFGAFCFLRDVNMMLPE